MSNKDSIVKNIGENKGNISNLKTTFNKTLQRAKALYDKLDAAKKQLKISKDKLIFGCYGGESSFDLKFVQSAIIDIVKKREDIVFIFLNINKFYNHRQIKFFKGRNSNSGKSKRLNQCHCSVLFGSRLIID